MILIQAMLLFLITIEQTFLVCLFCLCTFPTYI